MHRYVWLSLFVVSACASARDGERGPAEATPSPASQPASQPAATAAAPSANPSSFMPACVKACERQNMARAVSAQMITSQCESGCAADAKLPLVTDQAGLDAAAQQRVKVRGALHGRSIRLASGATLSLESGPALNDSDLEALQTKDVVVVGTLEGTQLTLVTTVAPAP